MQKALPISPELARRLSGRPVALLLDIDGTLSPIAPTPDLAVVPGPTLAVIDRLEQQTGVHVAVVTGRSVADARRLVPLHGIGIVGNHGFEVLGEDGEMIVVPEAQAYRHALAQAARRLDALAAPHPGAFVEDKTWTLSIHYRIADPSIVPELSAAVRKIASDLGLVLTSGKEVLELRPPVAVNKGTASIAWATRVGAFGAAGACLYIGDDRTDEDAFRALRAHDSRAVTIRVGAAAGAPSDAEFGLGDPTEVREFLEELSRR